MTFLAGILFVCAVCLAFFGAMSLTELPGALKYKPLYVPERSEEDRMKITREERKRGVVGIVWTCSIFWGLATPFTVFGFLSLT